MRNRRLTVLICRWMLGSLVLGPFFCSWGMAAGDHSRDLAKQGWLTFREVLAGDQGKLEVALFMQ